MRSTSACGGSHLVAQPVPGGLHSFLGAGAQRGANAALAGTGHGFSEMHALSIFGVKVWALNIETKIRRETLQDLARQQSPHEGEEPGGEGEINEDMTEDRKRMNDNKGTSEQAGSELSYYLMPLELRRSCSSIEHGWAQRASSCLLAANMQL